MPKLISLTQNKFAIVDDEDYDRIASLCKWRTNKNGNTCYAVGWIRLSEGGRISVKMHRIILNTPGGLKTDHINGNGLDNRKCNLRVATDTENMRNSRIPKNNTSGYKGVNYSNETSRNFPWRSAVRLSDRTVVIGYFPSAEDAGRAYDSVATYYFGEFARTNFPNPIPMHEDEVRKKINRKQFKTSRYKGVWLDKRTRKYGVTVYPNKKLFPDSKKQLFLGYFEKEFDAAKKYAEASLLYRNEEVVLSNENCL